MRREEAEAEAAWRNKQDERRGRLEFYAFDPSAGLANDAWEVSMRLRSEPADVAAPPPESVSPDLSPEDERVPGSAEPTADYPPSEPAEAYPPAPRRRGLRRRRRAEEELAAEPRTPLGRVVRVVGVAVIAVALLWVGATTALLVMVGGTSPSGLALYGAALLAGFIAMALGFAIRRS
jgi:hypothetical protein